MVKFFLVIVGVMGVVGKFLCELFEEWDFFYGRIKFFVLKWFVGIEFDYWGEKYLVEVLDGKVFEGIEFVIVSIFDDVFW